MAHNLFPNQNNIGIDGNNNGNKPEKYYIKYANKKTNQIPFSLNLLFFSNNLNQRPNQ